MNQTLALVMSGRAHAYVNTRSSNLPDGYWYGLVTEEAAEIMASEDG